MLPSCLLSSSYKDFQEYIDALHQLFERDVVQEIAKGNLNIDGVRIAYRRMPIVNGKPECFWHLVTEGRTEETRQVSMSRCERLPWLPYMLRNYNTDPELSTWTHVHEGNVCKYIWHEGADHLVVLEQRKGYWLLKTAYPTNNPKYRRTKAILIKSRGQAKK